jgi:hypothetical protein
MMDRARLLIAAAGVACAGLAAGHAMADDAALKSYPGAKEQILSYYNANAREGAGNCGAGNIQNISDVKVLKDDASSVVMAVQYEFAATTLQGGAERCSGVNTREFTFAKSGTGLSITEMSGMGP